MATNVFLLSTPDKIAIYLSLVLCGLSIILLALHVQRKFVRARGALATLDREWQDAQANFLKIADVARQQIGSMESAAPSVRMVQPAGEISLDLRNQVRAMGKRGKDSSEIARTAGLSEAEVDVLLGMSRIADRKK